VRVHAQSQRLKSACSTGSATCIRASAVTIALTSTATQSFTLVRPCHPVAKATSAWALKMTVRNACPSTSPTRRLTIPHILLNVDLNLRSCHVMPWLTSSFSLMAVVAWASLAGQQKSGQLNSSWMLSLAPQHKPEFPQSSTVDLLRGQEYTVALDKALTPWRWKPFARSAQ